MPGITWVKIMLSTFDDEKIKVIDSLPERDAVIVIWLKLIILAGKVNNLGYIYLTEGVSYSDEMLSTIFNRPVNTVRLALETFKKFKMIEIDEKGIYVINFQKYQNIEGMEKLRDQWKLASNRYRQKQIQLTVGSDRHMKSYDGHNTEVEVDKNKNIDSSSSVINVITAAATLETYKETLKKEFPNIDVEFEYRKYLLFFKEKNLLTSQTSLYDWIAKSHEFKHNGNGHELKNEIPRTKYKYVN